MKTEIHASRICQSNQVSVTSREYVLYWMQQSQRAVWNPALEYAIERANELKQPLLVCFGVTHDSYWNAAMKEMRFTGYMHNHMRMYWGKKILEWTAAPEEAHATALAINNKYFLDGRDANSFTNIAWIFGQHDRPWPERPVFGKVRYMNAAGLERKCDIDAYVAKVERLVAHAKR